MGDLEVQGLDWEKEERQASQRDLQAARRIVVVLDQLNIALVHLLGVVGMKPDLVWLCLHNAVRDLQDVATQYELRPPIGKEGQ